jgi:hypothetical protein
VLQVLQWLLESGHHKKPTAGGSLRTKNSKTAVSSMP